jgi:hypothetical protein
VRIRRIAPVLAVLTTLGALATTATAAGAAGGSGATACGIAVTDRPVHAAAALAALRGTVLLRAAANVNDTSPAELRARLRTDPTLWLDRCGRAFYVDPAPSTTATRSRAASSPAAAPFPNSQTFTLHSLPGSNRVIYLDFHGRTVTGTAWNDAETGPSFPEPPFDTDGNPASFSASEQAVIQSVWQRVSEDYAPFDVDVTTEDPGAAAIDRASGTDTKFGTRLLVTDDVGPGGVDCTCGGISYIGVFDQAGSHEYYQPSFVFASQLAYTAKDIAEAAAHEVGHALGLSTTARRPGRATTRARATGLRSWVSATAAR